MIDLELEHPHRIDASHPILGGMIVRPVSREGTYYRVEHAAGSDLIPAELLTPLPKFRGDTVVRLVELVRDEKPKEGKDDANPV